MRQAYTPACLIFFFARTPSEIPQKEGQEGGIHAITRMVLKTLCPGMSDFSESNAS
jgi:hypothetical protein